MSRPTPDLPFAFPTDELTFTYARSGGPGGQHVNKVSSKAVMHWDLTVSAAVPADVVERFRVRYGSRLREDGVLVLQSQEHRTQAANRRACEERLAQMLAAVARPPKKRVKTRPTKSSVEKRLQHKARAAARKRLRRPVADD